MRVYSHYIAFNAMAVDLLEIHEGDALSVMQDDREGYIYVSNNPDAKVAFGVRRRANTFEVCNTQLARRLAELMEGEGAYRICAEDAIEFMGHKYYNVFAKKYGKD